ncbi:hypothetical protein [Rhizobium phage RHph_X2_26]|nr:hypothetical protein [Rhizobium phage RHph_X2_26]
MSKIQIGADAQLAVAHGENAYLRERLLVATQMLLEGDAQREKQAAEIRGLEDQVTVYQEAVRNHEDRARAVAEAPAPTVAQDGRYSALHKLAQNLYSAVGGKLGESAVHSAMQDLKRFFKDEGEVNA